MPFFVEVEGGTKPFRRDDPRRRVLSRFHRKKPLRLTGVHETAARRRVPRPCEPS